VKSRRVRAIIAGATGYSGRELIRLLLQHPRLEIAGVFASRSSEAQPVAAIHPQLTGLTDLECRPFDEREIGQLDAQLIFLATPNEFSHEVVPGLLEAGLTVVDLSGAFRLRRPDEYPHYYGFEHSRPDLLRTAVYGLTEFARDSLHQARLIANPGCYPTSVLIPVAPLVEAGIVEPDQPIICDSKSGVTGAGKTPTNNTHFSEVTESLKAYSLFRHRHSPEIAQGLSFDGLQSRVVFTPHLLPINRGILSTIYFKAAPGVSSQEIARVWQSQFSRCPFVRVFPEERLPEIKFAANTPFCDIGCVVDSDSRQAIAFGAIDNLLKGAASQAVQNANLALGFNEADGIWPHGAGL